MAKILIGYSTCKVTQAAFANHGHDVWTCDLLPAEGQHIQADIWTVAYDGWDMALFHPMCTYLTTSAAWAYTDGPYHQQVKPGTLVGQARREARAEALENFRRLLALPYPKAIENPAFSFINTSIRRYDQVIQPYQFGDDASKATGLWLDRLPKLNHTLLIPPRIVNGKSRWRNQTDSGQNRLSPSEDRWLLRSKTYPGIANAIGDQYGRLL